MLTDIVTKSFHNLKLQREMNILQENYSSIDSYNLKLQSIMIRFILEKNHMLTDIVTKSYLNLKLQRDMNISNAHWFWNLNRIK
jgi:hypothetical protein